MITNSKRFGIPANPPRKWPGTLERPRVPFGRMPANFAILVTSYGDFTKAAGLGINALFSHWMIYVLRSISSILGFVPSWPAAGKDEGVCQLAKGDRV